MHHGALVFEQAVCQTKAAVHRVDEVDRRFVCADCLIAIRQRISAAVERENQQIRKAPAEIDARQAGDRVARVFRRELWFGVDRNAVVERTEDRHRDAALRLARDVGAPHGHAAVHLLKPLVLPSRQQRVVVYLPPSQLAGALHPIDANVPLAKAIRAFRSCGNDKGPHLGGRFR